MDKVGAANSNDEQDFATFPTYWSKWKMLYPHMKLSFSAKLLLQLCSQALNIIQPTASNAVAAAAAGDNACG